MMDAKLEAEAASMAKSPFAVGVSPVIEKPEPRTSGTSRTCRAAKRVRA